MQLSTFVVFLALAVAVRGQMSSCTSNAQYTIPSDTATFGCQGYGNSVSVSWNLTALDSRMLSFTAMNTENGYDKVTITQGSTVWGPFSGTINPGSRVFADGMPIIVTFTSDQSVTDPGFNISMTPTPDFFILFSAQPVTVEPKQDGGFVYFGLQAEAMGLNFFVDTVIHSYQGLQPPSLFVAVNRFPTLESYDYTNTTIAYGDGYQAFLEVSGPAAGDYFIGLFMYGISTDIDMLAQWTYNLPYLQPGSKVTNNTSAGYPVVYQTLVPQGDAQLVWQFSRQVPGGHPIAYIGQGYVPGPNNYHWIMDTSQQSYIRLAIPNPNPYNNQSPNPGNYIIAIYDANQEQVAAFDKAAKEKQFKPEEFTPLTSGFILQVDY